MNRFQLQEENMKRRRLIEEIEPRQSLLPYPNHIFLNTLHKPGSSFSL